MYITLCCSQIRKQFTLPHFLCKYCIYFWIKKQFWWFQALLVNARLWNITGIIYMFVFISLMFIRVIPKGKFPLMSEQSILSFSFSFLFQMRAHTSHEQEARINQTATSGGDWHGTNCIILVMNRLYFCKQRFHVDVNMMYNGRWIV